MGYPNIVVIGSKAASVTPKVELHLPSGDAMDVEPSEALALIAKYINYKRDLYSTNLVCKIKSITNNL